MNTVKLLETLEIIKRGDYPKEQRPFEGADIVITDQPVEPLPEDANWLLRGRHDNYVWVVTDHVSELSWLVYQLKEVFWDELDYFNKYAFYPGLGNTMNEALQRKNTLKEIMLYTVIQSILFWIIPREIPKKEEIILDLLETKAGPVPEPEDDGITIGQILKANEEGRPIAEDRNEAMRGWMKKAMGKE
jgi:hypothetical protein